MEFIDKRNLNTFASRDELEKQLEDQHQILNNDLYQNCIEKINFQTILMTMYSGERGEMAVLFNRWIRYCLLLRFQIY